MSSGSSSPFNMKSKTRAGGNRPFPVVSFPNPATRSRVSSGDGTNTMTHRSNPASGSSAAQDQQQSEGRSAQDQPREESYFLADFTSPKKNLERGIVTRMHQRPIELAPPAVMRKGKLIPLSSGFEGDDDETPFESFGVKIESAVVRTMDRGCGPVYEPSAAGAYVTETPSAPPAEVEEGTTVDDGTPPEAEPIKVEHNSMLPTNKGVPPTDSAEMPATVRAESNTNQVPAVSSASSTVPVPGEAPAVDMDTSGKEAETTSKEPWRVWEATGNNRSHYVNWNSLSWNQGPSGWWYQEEPHKPEPVSKLSPPSLGRHGSPCGLRGHDLRKVQSLLDASDNSMPASYLDCRPLPSSQGSPPSAPPLSNEETQVQLENLLIRNDILAEEKADQLKKIHQLEREVKRVMHENKCLTRSNEEYKQMRYQWNSTRSEARDLKGKTMELERLEMALKEAIHDAKQKTEEVKQKSALVESQKQDLDRKDREINGIQDRMDAQIKDLENELSFERQEKENLSVKVKDLETTIRHTFAIIGNHRHPDSFSSIPSVGIIGHTLLTDQTNGPIVEQINDSSIAPVIGTISSPSIDSDL